MVSDRREQAGLDYALDYAFVGGSIVNLFLDHPALSPARPTDDVDVIVETLTSRRNSQDVDAHFSINRTGYFFGLCFGVAERALVVVAGRRASSRSSFVCWIISFSQMPVILSGTPA